MAKVEILVDRPVKRQKVSHDSHTSPLGAQYPGYIVLAHRSFTVTLNDTAIEKTLMRPAPQCVIEITGFSSASGSLLFQAKSPAQKVQFELAIGQPDKDIIEFVTDCVPLFIPVASSKKNGNLPLAKQVASLMFDGNGAKLRISLLWQDSQYAREKSDPRLRWLLAKYADKEGQANDFQLEPVAWEVREFYDNVHVPPVTNVRPLKLDTVQCTLYPFQDRATRWMLSKEGVEVLPSGQIARPSEISTCLPLDFEEFNTADGAVAYYSRALNVVCSSRMQIDLQYGPIRGGILAEAMGLGKTVEMIALMCAHTASQSPVKIPAPDGQQSTGATLIITPPTILEQWKQEIREHAPSLRVYHYTGIRTAAKRKDENIVSTLAEQDVVLTTYNVIASEIYYAQERPDRNLRSRPRREAPKSPLTQLLWWRCLLDEAQMVESGVSNAAVVARLIPRVNAWAVTGTPLKQSHRDLYGLLLFLRHEPWCQSPAMWDYLVLYHRPLLRKLISSLALRHTKDQVREELRIPEQSRRLVTIPFTPVEESHYAQMHYDMRQDCSLDSSGAPLVDDWDSEDPAMVEKMRHWLQRLRQTCLHPEVGGRNRRALGKRGGGPLRTVAEVLEVMIEQAETVVRTEQRNVLMAQADQARLFEHARESQIAQDMFSRALLEASEFVQACRRELETESRTHHNDAVKSVHKDMPEVSSDAEDDEADSSLTAAKQRLRSALEVQHICLFFLGNTYYQLKVGEESKLPPLADKVAGVGSGAKAEQSPDAAVATEGREAVQTLESIDEAKIRTKIKELEICEAQTYEEAKTIRTELLAEAHRKATKHIKLIRAKRNTDSFVAIPEMVYAEDDYGGIESRKVFEKLYHYCQAMNEQAKQFIDIRMKMKEMLCQVLIDEEEGVELTGEEYEDSTKHQDDMYVYMEMLRALFADRSDAISGQENQLLKSETKQFLRSAREGEGPAPELMIRLMGERQQFRIDPSQQGSLRGILTEIRSLASALEYQELSSVRARAELKLVHQILQHVQRLMTEQSKTVSALEQEVNLFRGAMNARLDYYRALQVISDMVAPIGKEEDVGQPVDQAWLKRLQNTEEVAAKKLSVALSKKRYLLHLKNEQETEGDARICTICQSEFEIGTLTVCGHQFCKECIQIWWSEHRNCPICKRRLVLQDFHDVTYKSQELSKGTEEDDSAGTSARNDKHINNNVIYTNVSDWTLSQIQSIDLRGPSYGSKVDTIVRHILHLRKSDAGSKTVIFSQYRDFLDVLSKCLNANSIIHSKFDDKDGIVDFKSNPANECFLLHAKAHAAGLNLVCASHVILCEPLINTAIELQAIARVHRIGQVRETCVWMYLIEGTVEEAIYDISVRRRLAHMDGKSRDASRIVSRAVTPSRGEKDLEAANAKELQAADLGKMFTSGKAGGEMVDKEDLWQCLFGNAKTKSSGERNGPSRGLVNLPAASEAVGAGGEIARHIRVEAAEGRRGL